jgi:hypothetical protein
MEVDESIIQLGQKLDAWFDTNAVTFASEDQVTQGKALLAGIEIMQELDRLKADGMAAIQELLDDRKAPSSRERVASLIRGFEFGAKLADTLHDELLDTDGETRVMRLTDAIVKALDAIGAGREALGVLLDHPDAGVRALAGAYLIDLMPDRVVPILRDIEQTEHGNSAHFRADFAVLGWERQRKSRFNFLND